jgi:large-conductance mechanosensitive channel
MNKTIVLILIAAAIFFVVKLQQKDKPKKELPKPTAKDN